MYFTAEYAILYQQTESELTTLYLALAICHRAKADIHARNLPDLPEMVSGEIKLIFYTYRIW